MAIFDPFLTIPINQFCSVSIVVMMNMVVIMISKWIFENMPVTVCPARHSAPALRCATRPPSAPRPCHARPTHRPSVSPAKAMPPMPDHESGGRGEAPTRARVARSPGRGRIRGKGVISQHFRIRFPPGFAATVPS